MAATVSAPAGWERFWFDAVVASARCEWLWFDAALGVSRFSSLADASFQTLALVSCWLLPDCSLGFLGMLRAEGFPGAIRLAYASFQATALG